MRIVIKTKVDQNTADVFAGFTRHLFLKLSPPFPRVKILRFDGCKKGDKVRLELNLVVVKQIWESLIVEYVENPDNTYFIDEGIVLPFFLKSWKHKHIINKNGNGALIIDDITYKAPNLLFSYLLYPLLFLQFLYRKPIYQRTFRKK